MRITILLFANVLACRALGLVDAFAFVEQPIGALSLSEVTSDWPKTPVTG